VKELLEARGAVAEGLLQKVLRKSGGGSLSLKKCGKKKAEIGKVQMSGRLPGNFVRDGFWKSCKCNRPDFSFA
jgi:hypothetical protein